MQNALSRAAANYFNSWWLPAAAFLVVLGGFAATATSVWRPFAVAAQVLFCTGAATFLGIVAACIWNFLKKRWMMGIANLILIPVCGVATVYVFAFLIFNTMFGPSEDGFADNLKIPTDIEVAEPTAGPGTPVDKAADTFQAAMLASLKSAKGRDPTINGDISSLARLQVGDPDLLRRYLASHPGWRVFDETGNLFATRRWIVGSEWSYNLHGYYTDGDFWPDSEISRFQTRLTIGLSGEPWARCTADTTRLDAGKAARAALLKGKELYESHCVISSGLLVVEVFEQSGTPERRLSNSALEFLEEEMKPLAANPSWENAKQLLPPGGIRRGAPSLELRNSFQPGLYNSAIWVNPGDAGMVYLKAFEVTKGTPLSVGSLREYSNEWIGWSSDPEELFFSNTHFTIYEGDWGKPYAARFEVWFKSDSGGAERKLIERVFKIEGWQR